MVTNGERVHWLAENVARLRRMGLDACEIIICGKVDHLRSRDGFQGVRLIALDETDARPCLSRKKNRIIEVASHENVCLFHDRIRIETDFGDLRPDDNHFDILAARCTYAPLGLPALSVRAQDWMTYGRRIEADPRARDASGLALLPYDMWSPHAYANGSFVCVKRSIAKGVRFDETLNWCEFDDVEWCHRAFRRGFVTSLSTRLSLTTRVFKHPFVKVVERGRMSEPRLSMKQVAPYLVAMAAGPMLRHVQAPRFVVDAETFFRNLEETFLGADRATDGAHAVACARLSNVFGDGAATAVFFATLYARLADADAAAQIGVAFFQMPADRFVDAVFAVTHFRPLQPREKQEALARLSAGGSIARLSFLKKRATLEVAVKFFAHRLFRKGRSENRTSRL